MCDTIWKESEQLDINHKTFTCETFPVQFNHDFQVLIPINYSDLHSLVSTIVMYLFILISPQQQMVLVP